MEKKMCRNNFNYAVYSPDFDKYYVVSKTNTLTVHTRGWRKKKK